MPIILTWVLFCSKCAELLLDQEKQRVTNLKDGPRFFWDHLLPTADAFFYFRWQRSYNKTTARWSVQLVKADKSYSYVPRLLRVIICMRQQDNER
jgi:hypothetical protein